MSFLGEWFFIFFQSSFGGFDGYFLLSLYYGMVRRKDFVSGPLTK